MPSIYTAAVGRISSALTYCVRRAVGGILLAMVALNVGAAPPAQPLRSGCELDYPPFCVVEEDGHADGFSVELLRAALHAMGRTVTFRTGNWGDVRGWLERGEVDCLPLVGRTPEREALFDFTVPYMTMHGAIVVRDDTAGVHTLADLAGKRVAVMAGDNAEEFVRREPRDFEILTTPTFSAALEQLSRGACDAVVIQRLVALRLLAQTGLSNLRIVKQPVAGFAQDFCFAVTEGDRDTLALLNEGLALIVADGTHRRLHAKWFAALELPSDRSLIIGGDRNYPPYEFLDENGRPAGYNVDLMRAVADALGLNIAIRLGSWDDTVQALADDRIDAVQGMSFSLERDRVFDFSEPHTVDHYVAITRQGEGAPPETVANLAGKRLVVVNGGFMNQFLITQGVRADIAVVDTQEEALRQLAEGRYDYALGARTTALYLIDSHDWPLAVGRKPFISADYCFAVPHGHKALLAELNEGLHLVVQSGAYREIHNKWLGAYEESGVSVRKVLGYIAVVVIPLLLVLALVLLWTHMLHRQVIKRTAQLRRSEEKYRVITEQTEDLIWRMDMNLTITYVNPAVETILGFTPEAFVGKPLEDYCDAEHYATIVELIKAKTALPPEDANTVLETELLSRQGHAVPVEVHGTVIFDQDGQPIAIQGVTRDITERKRQETRLAHLNRVLRAIRDVNQLITHEKDRSTLLHQSCNILVETRGYRSAWIALQTGAGGLRTTASAGIGEDFDEIKAQLDADNWPACCQKAMDHPDRIVIMRSTDTNCCNCPVAHEYRDTAALAYALGHGDHVYGVLVVALPVGMADDPDEQSLFKELAGDLGYALYSLDNEARRREAEQSLRASEELLNETGDMARVGGWELDLRTDMVTWTRTTRAIHEVTDDHVPTLEEALDFFPEARAELAEAIQRAREDGVSYDMTLPFVTARGRKLWVHTVGRAEFENGQCVRLHGAFQDVTDQKILEDDLAEAYLLYRETVRGGRVGLWDRNLITNTVYFSSEWKGQIGYADDEIENDFEVWRSHVHPDDLADAERIIAQAIAECSEAFSLEFRFRHKDGSYRWILSQGSVITDETGKAVRVVGSHTDITERVTLEEDLEQARKLESVGRLAGGVAHDFNNLLMGMMNYVELCRDELDSNHPVQKWLNEIMTDAKRSATVVRQLLAFARKQTIAPRFIDLNAEVEAMLTMLRRLIGEDVDLLWEPASRLRKVEMDPAQINQILTNLCVNARDAIAGVGTITIKTDNVSLDAAYCAGHAEASEGDFVVLTVRDNGCGMDAETLDNIFEPFYTTKPQDKGTGLGLATLYGIAKQNGGFISVESEPAKGTTFRVYLPVAEGHDTVAPSASQSEPSSKDHVKSEVERSRADRRCQEERQRAAPKRGGRSEKEGDRAAGETILFVEDEKSIRVTVTMFLRGLGYTVVTAADPEDALSTIADYDGNVDLLITDVVMPGMSGRELAQQLEAAYPDIDVLYISGYTANVIAERGILEDHVAFLSKPFTRDQLARKVREILG